VVGLADLLAFTIAGLVTGLAVLVILDGAGGMVGTVRAARSGDLCAELSLERGAVRTP
jgi:hypothetical protein